jgi:hypothetical protein
MVTISEQVPFLTRYCMCDPVTLSKQQLPIIVANFKLTFELGDGQAAHS